jgi:hypothetical protein
VRPADVLGRIAGPLMLAGGAATEAVVIHQSATDLSWASGIVLAGSAVGAAGLALATDRRVRNAVAAAAVALLLIAPGAWAVQTLGHATSSTFPAGGPSSAATMGMGGGGGRGGMGGGGGTRPTGTPPGATATAGASAGGGMFSGDTTNLTAAVAYAKAHGGGTVAISSQSGASAAIIAGGADVAALGGFSGRESEVSARWLAAAVRDGKVRWVLTGGDSRGPSDGRTGASALMAAVAKTCTPISLGSSSSSTLYDCQGHAGALAAITST